ncbi:biliverdin-producing heme oxygenase, partial [Pseudomonas viridiflava]
YARFVVAQYLFQAELQGLYNDPALQAIIADLPERCRAAQARDDLADLGLETPSPVAGAVHQPSLAQALGWLFVSEGSKLGAAFLIKRAVALNLSDSFGARHL